MFLEPWIVSQSEQNPQGFVLLWKQNVSSGERRCLRWWLKALIVEPGPDLSGLDHHLFKWFFTSPFISLLGLLVTGSLWDIYVCLLMFRIKKERHFYTWASMSHSLTLNQPLVFFHFPGNTTWIAALPTPLQMCPWTYTLDFQTFPASTSQGMAISRRFVSFELSTTSPVTWGSPRCGGDTPSGLPLL